MRITLCVARTTSPAHRRTTALPLDRDRLARRPPVSRAREAGVREPDARHTTQCSRYCAGSCVIAGTRGLGGGWSWFDPYENRLQTRCMSNGAGGSDLSPRTTELEVRPRGVREDGTAERAAETPVICAVFTTIVLPSTNEMY